MAKKWSRNFEACRNCGTTEVKHMAQGLCRRCYLSVYRNENAERIAELKREWYLLNVAGTDKQKAAREDRNFDGKRQAVLKRDGYRCVRCGSAKNLTVHHKDRSGRGAKSHNNAMKNLETVCRKCHINEHREELQKAKTPKTHCKNGHAFAQHGHHNGRQVTCRICCSERARKYRAKRLAAAAS